MALSEGVKTQRFVRRWRQRLWWNRPNCFCRQRIICLVVFRRCFSLWIGVPVSFRGFAPPIFSPRSRKGQSISLPVIFSWCSYIPKLRLRSCWNAYNVGLSPTLNANFFGGPFCFAQNWGAFLPKFGPWTRAITFPFHTSFWSFFTRVIFPCISSCYSQNPILSMREQYPTPNASRNEVIFLLLVNLITSRIIFRSLILVGNSICIFISSDLFNPPLPSS